MENMNHNHLHQQHHHYEHHELEREDTMTAGPIRPWTSGGSSSTRSSIEVEGNTISGGEDSMSMMKMYFHFGLGDQMLFSNLILDSNFKLWLTCLVIFLLSLLLEVLKSLRNLKCKCQMRRIFFLAPSKQSPNTHITSSSSSSTSSHHHRHETSNHDESHRELSQRLCCSGPTQAGGRNNTGGTLISHCRLGLFKPDSSSYRLVQASLQLLCTTLSLTLMLIVMTYNICLIFAIVLGSSVGVYLFQRASSATEEYEIGCCH